MKKPDKPSSRIFTHKTIEMWEQWEEYHNQKVAELEAEIAKLQAQKEMAIWSLS